MSTYIFQYTKWTLITIDDPAFLPGKSIFDIIQLSLKVIKFEFVILNQIYGVNETIASLEKKENTILKISELLDVICNVKQFDWGDFFLFKEEPKNWDNKDEIIDYPKLVIQSDTTIRAVDDQYIYIYTPYQELVDLIKKNYKIEGLKTDYLNNLDYPY